MTKELLKQRIRCSVWVDRKGCWVWGGPTAYAPNEQDRPYGYLAIGGKRHSVRRIVYELYDLGKLGDNAVVASCKNSLCVNPAHLAKSTKLKSSGRGIKANPKTP